MAYKSEQMPFEIVVVIALGKSNSQRGQIGHKPTAQQGGTHFFAAFLYYQARYCQSSSL